MRITPLTYPSSHQRPCQMTTKICPGCKCKFLKRDGEKPSQFKKRKYCKQECYKRNANYSRNIKDYTGIIFNKLEFIKPGNRDKLSGGVLWVVKCHCGELFETRPYRIFTEVTKSCGCYRRKYSSEQAKKYIGELHPNWNPELTDEQRISKRNISGVVDWRNSVYQRDYYTCKVCNKKGGKLNAHHIDGWNWCTEKRFDVDNGITLCESCHEDFHSVYGKGDNTEEEFLLFSMLSRI